ncbi:hypothetical protein GCM10007063_03310 [Lentibacillus kapialis]|uniref:SPOR domain-containing protein n=1 Tax=Lentibacillus kapialis TaxID=340214 RepID=A0A917UT67_9BACI|nr:SPOR domain-containing protein [Lentibacillus kapialis]GGJ84149.1 hypothetical protein GCM10007063_03310 [Lentibacillus kapialis]
MNQNKKTNVLTNDKKKKLKKKTKHANKQPTKESNEEHAAALENSNIPEYIRQEDEDDKGHNKDIHYKQNSNLTKAKPFLIASISAVIIGGVLGFFMLNMFVDIDGNIGQQGGSSASAVSDKENSTADAQSDVVAIDANSAFAVQAGKFSEQANAEEMAAVIQDAGSSAMIWENNSFYFVLSGISMSEQQAEQTATVLANSGIDTYVKEWATEASKITLMDSEKEWLQMFEKQWNKSLKSVSSGNHLSKDAWAGVVNAIPENTDSITSLTEAVQKEHQAMGKTDNSRDQIILLNLWEKFNKLVSK